jgi:hypothetical protein
MWSDRDCEPNSVQNVSIAHRHIKSRRAAWRVTVAQGGTLADYVPFYYAPRSPMLYAIHTRYVDGYEGDQDEIVHLVLAAETVAQQDRFLITDGHACTPLSSQHADLAALDEVITWPIMRARYWSDNDEEGDRTRRRQAEFLVWSSVPFDAVRLIGVRTTKVARRAAESLVGASHVPEIVVRPDWYY